MKKITLLLCALLMSALLLSLPTQAEAAEILNSGTCGADLTWTLTDDGVLTISGTGSMRNYATSDPTGAPAPWGNDTRIVSVVIEDGVTTIGNYAFSNCLALEEISIPDSVTSIGKYAFQRCSSLTGITLPSNITAIPDGMLLGCGRIAEFTVPNTVTTIGAEAFMDCVNLNNVILPDSVTEIGISAFEKCARLTSVTIPDSVVTIGENTFNNCTSLTSVTFGSGLKNVGANCFRNTKALTAVYVEDIAHWCQIDFAFPFANPITNATLYVAGQRLTELIVPEGVTRVGNHTFNSYPLLTSATFSETVTEIGDYAFNNCLNLASVQLSDSIVTLGEFAFRSCPISSITLSKSLEKIGFAAFQYCKGLTSIVIPEQVTSIGEIAFYGCNAVTDLTLGASIAEIGPSAFEKCDALWHILYRGSTEDWDTISIDSSNQLLTSITRHDNYTGNEQIDFANKTCAVCSCTHIWDDGTAIKEATCKEEGSTAYTCTLCHTAKTESTPKLTNHTPGAPATATSDQVCTVCGKVLENATGETEPVTTPTTAPSTTPTEPVINGNEDNTSNWMIAAVAIGLSVAVAIGIIIKRKKH